MLDVTNKKCGPWLQEQLKDLVQKYQFDAFYLDMGKSARFTPTVGRKTIFTPHLRDLEVSERVMDECSESFFVLKNCRLPTVFFSSKSRKPCCHGQGITDSRYFQVMVCTLNSYTIHLPQRQNHFGNTVRRSTSSVVAIVSRRLAFRLNSPVAVCECTILIRFDCVRTAQFDPITILAFNIFLNFWFFLRLQWEKLFKSCETIRWLLQQTRIHKKTFFFNVYQN